MWFISGYNNEHVSHFFDTHMPPVLRRDTCTKGAVDRLTDVFPGPLLALGEGL